MNAPTRIASIVNAPGAASSGAALRRAEAPALARRLSSRLGNQWLPRAAWTISRTGRPGLVGIALLLGAALFLFSTHLKVAAEVEALRDELAAAQRGARTLAAVPVAVPATATRTLPSRSDMPTIMGRLFQEAERARLAVESAQYEVSAMGSGGVVRYRITFPVTGPYPQIRAFIDSTLATIPAVALSELALERTSIGDGNVEAQLQMTVYTRSAP